MPRGRLLAALAFLLFAGLAGAQDPVMVKIDADELAWRNHLAQQYRSGQLNRWDYERQIQTLDTNIAARRQARINELQQAEYERNLREREVRAMEGMAARPTGPRNCTIYRNTMTCD